MLSYQTAYFKANYPSEFMAALLSNEIGNAEKLLFFIGEARDMGIDVLPPDINESDTRFLPADKCIRFGMAGIKNVGVGAVEEIVEERQANGLFTGFMNFCQRMDSQACNRKTMESLIKCSAFDFTGISRGRLFENIDFALHRASSTQRDRDSGQGSLFEMLEGSVEETDMELADHPPWPQSVLLAEEKELLGFYISGHPLDEYGWILDTFASLSPAKLDEVPPGTMLRMGGLVTQFQKRYTRRTQKAMGVFRLEHLDGGIEVVVFPEAFRDCGNLLEENRAVLVTGDFDKGEELKLKANQVVLLDQVPDKLTRQLVVRLPVAEATEASLQKIRAALSRHPGMIEVTLALDFPCGNRVFLRTDSSYRVTPNAELAHALSDLVGEQGVRIIQRKPERKGNGQHRYAARTSVSAR